MEKAGLKIGKILQVLGSSKSRNFHIASGDMELKNGCKNNYLQKKLLEKIIIKFLILDGLKNRNFGVASGGMVTGNGCKNNEKK